MDGLGQEAAQEQLNHTIVIDNGSGWTKAGQASDAAPRSVFPAIVGRPKEAHRTEANDRFYVGDEAKAKRDMLSLRYPIEHGNITSWDGIEAIWDHVFRVELRVDPSRHAVALTEAPLAPRADRDAMIELLFERFEVEAVHVESTAELALRQTGRSTGLVLDIGDALTCAVPIHEGVSIGHAIGRWTFAGRDLTDYLVQLLTERGHLFTTSEERDVVEDIKTTLCYVVADYDSTMNGPEGAEYYDPDESGQFDADYALSGGQVITIGSERFRCPEALFEPALVKRHEPGVHELVRDAILACDANLHAELFANIVVAGASSLFDGFAERLTHELGSLDHGFTPKIIAPPGRKYQAWLGAAALASDRSLVGRGITRAEHGTDRQHNSIIRRGHGYSAVRNADGRLQALGVGTDGSLWHRTQTEASGTTWSAWASLGGQTAANPTSVRHADGRLEVFVRGTDDAIWSRTQTEANGTAWSSWASLGGEASGDPIVLPDGDGRLYLFVRGPDGTLWSRVQAAPNASTWSSWTSLGGTITSSPSAELQADGRVAVFARGPGDALWHIGQTAPGADAWSSWISLGGAIVSRPVVYANGDRRLQVFARGTDDKLWSLWQSDRNSATWSAWDASDRSIASVPALTRDPEGRLELFVLDANGALLRRRQDWSGSVEDWSSWTTLGGTSTDLFGAITNTDGRVEVFTRGASGSLWRIAQTQAGADAWSAWASLEGQVQTFST